MWLSCDVFRPQIPRNAYPVKDSSVPADTLGPRVLGKLCAALDGIEVKTWRYGRFWLCGTSYRSRTNNERSLPTSLVGRRRTWLVQRMPAKRAFSVAAFRPITQDGRTFARFVISVTRAESRLRNTAAGQPMLVLTSNRNDNFAAIAALIGQARFRRRQRQEIKAGETQDDRHARGRRRRSSLAALQPLHRAIAGR
jgi:hypothetical protein